MFGKFFKIFRLRFMAHIVIRDILVGTFLNKNTLLLELFFTAKLLDQIRQTIFRSWCRISRVGIFFDWRVQLRGSVSVG